MPAVVHPHPMAMMAMPYPPLHIGVVPAELIHLAMAWNVPVDMAMAVHGMNTRTMMVMRSRVMAARGRSITIDHAGRNGIAVAVGVMTGIPCL